MAEKNINYPSPNLPATGSSITLTFFNGFFNQNFTFNANEFGAVYGMFKSLRLDDISTYTLTFSVLAEAMSLGYKPIDLVRKILTKEGLKFTPDTVIIFNRVRKKNSFIGYRITNSLNPYVEHMLVE